MTLPELQSCLDSLGAKLSLRLVVDAPAGVITAELRDALATHKGDLLRRLVEPGSAGLPEAAVPAAPVPAVEVPGPAVPGATGPTQDAATGPAERCPLFDVGGRAYELAEDLSDRQAIAAQGDRLRAEGRALPLCWIPAPQERAPLAPLPGRRGGKQLWFE
jgi:hypothetical protein